MKPEQAKIILNIFSRKVLSPELQGAFSLAISALEKQIPKEPTERGYLKDALLHIGRCPLCGEGNNSEFKYCPNCGQALD